MKRWGSGVVALVAVSVAACGAAGSDQADVDARSASREGSWVAQRLEGEAGDDQPVRLAVDGQQVVVVVASEAGVVTGYTSDGGRFTSGEPLATGQDFLSLGGVARVGNDYVTLGSGGRRDSELAFDLAVYRSDDGASWSPETTTGLEGPADLGALAAVDGGLVAVGAQRTAAIPRQGGFRPVAWHSPDGVQWTVVPLPGAEVSIEGGIALSLVAVDDGDQDRLLAGGTVDGQGVLWASDDGGATWAVAEPAGLPPLTSVNFLAVQGQVVLASGTAAAAADGGDEGAGGAGSPVLARSSDGGQHWRPVLEPPPTRGVDLAAPLYAGGGRFFTLAASFVDTATEPELCYADIELCRRDTTTALYRSDDGETWARVDTTGLDDLDAVTATDDGRVVAVGRTADGVTTWTWPAGASLPQGEEPAEPTIDVDRLDVGEQPEPGRRYAVPLYIHCGMDWLYLGGDAWRRTDDRTAVEIGAGDAVPEHWPVAQQTIFGFATLVQPDLVEYSIGDEASAEVIALYAPASDPPPGCE